MTVILKSGVPLIVSGAVSVAQNCCCGTTATVCPTTPIGIGCFSDLGSYTNDSTGLIAYLSTIQIDITLPTSAFTGSVCGSTGLCDLNGRTQTLSYTGSGFVWNALNVACGATTASWSVDAACWDQSPPITTQDCIFTGIVNITGPGGFRRITWQKRYSGAMAFATLNESLPFKEDLDFGLSDAQCKGSTTSTATISIH